MKLNFILPQILLLLNVSNSYPVNFLDNFVILNIIFTLYKENMKSDKNSTVQAFRKILAESVDGREWEEYYYPDQLAKAIVVSAAEIQKEFQWVDDVEIWEKMNDKNDKKRFSKKIITLLHYVMIFADAMELDLVKASQKINLYNNTDLDQSL